MQLLADSGSTKTVWVLRDDNGVEKHKIISYGINPTLMADADITEILRDAISQMPMMKEADSIEFYGSGCTPQASPRMEQMLRSMLPQAKEVMVGSDIIGAAKALLGNNEGIACILGTGANSCLWDGEQIVSQTPALGYILGDEGGGAVLGKSLLNVLYKGGSSIVIEDGKINPLRLLRDAFEEEYHVSMADVITRVYRQPNANRWLASLSPFILSHCDNPSIRKMVIENFQRFFINNIKPYNRPELPVNFVGSIAHHYSELLTEAAEKEGFIIGRILRSPLEQ